MFRSLDPKTQTLLSLPPKKDLKLLTCVLASVFCFGPSATRVTTTAFSCLVWRRKENIKLFCRKNKAHGFTYIAWLFLLHRGCICHTVVGLYMPANDALGEY